MKWRGRRTSGNIEDRRGRGGGRVGGTAKVGGLGAIAILLIGMFLGVDVTPLLSGGTGALPPGQSQTQASGPNRIDDSTEEFIGVVLADTEAVWGDLFAQSGLTYEAPILVLYEGRTSSACGGANAAMGPFYCPGDKRIFLDTAFFRTMETRLGARGDFAKAYVIAHEVAHHVQGELGTLGKVNSLRRQVSKTESNALSVRTELQADCYSGLWAREVQARFGVLERGDIEEALTTAAAIGDDALQRAATGTVVPDSFTHGTSAQRRTWFIKGFETGDPQACDTFNTRL